MFEDTSATTKSKKSEKELLMELADLVAREKIDEKLGYEPHPINEERIEGILSNLGYRLN